jgi:putative transcriptional regulator
MSKQYRSQAMASIHETTEDLHTAGVMGSGPCGSSMRLAFPIPCLTAKEIRRLREREGASQAVFARQLNVTTGLVNKGNAVRSARVGRR